MEKEVVNIKSKSSRMKLTTFIGWKYEKNVTITNWFIELNCHKTQFNFFSPTKLWIHTGVFLYVMWWAWLHETTEGERGAIIS